MYIGHKIKNGADYTFFNLTYLTAYHLHYRLIKRASLQNEDIIEKKSHLHV